MKTRWCPSPAGTLPVSRHARTLLRKASALSATLLLALASVAQADPPTVAQLQPQVDALPNTTTQQKLMRAMLEWALSESTRETNAVYSNPETYTYEQNHVQVGLDLRSDVNDILHPGGGNTPQQIGFPQGASRTDIFPPIPHYTSSDRTNAVAINVDNATTAAITAFNGSSKKRLGTQNEQDLAVSECFCHPASSHYEDPALVPVIFDFLNVSLDTLGYVPDPNTGELNYNIVASHGAGGYNAGFDDTLAHEYVCLTTQYPDLILPRCRQRWEAGLYRISISFYAGDGPNITSNDPESFYPNVQGRNMGCVFFTSLALTGPNSTYNNAGFPYYGTVPATRPADVTPAQMKALAYTYLTVANRPSSQFADGGSSYTAGYPPVATYFGAELQNVAYIRQTVRGSSASDDVAATSTAASILQRARLYLPLYHPDHSATLDQGGLYDYEKQGFDLLYTWPALFLLDPDLTTARDPQLWRFVTENSSTTTGEVTLSSAASYNIDLKPSTLGDDEDNFLLYDQNFEGPYARFGNWFMLASARTSPDSKGVESNVDCTGLFTSGNVLFTATGTTGDDPGTYGTVTGPDKVASTIVQSTFASLALTHGARIRAGQHVHADRPWTDNEEWIFTPHRIVGLVSTKKTAAIPPTDPKNYPTPEVEAGYGFLSRYPGSSAFTNAASPTNVGVDLTVNSLVTHLVGSSYNGKVNSGSNPTSYYTVNDPADSNRPTLVVSDSGSTASHPNSQNYAVGTSGYTLVEYHPATTENDATGIVTVPVPANLFGFEFQDTDGAMYRIVHNPTNSDVSYTGAFPSSAWGSGSVVVHAAETPAVYASPSQNIPGTPEVVGETFRSAWVSTNGTTALSPVEAGLATISGGSVTVTVPANSHVVFTQALGVVAGAVYEIEPVCSPGTRLDVTSKGTADGTTVQLYQRTGGPNQQWMAVASGSNFRFNPMHAPNSSMSVLGGGTASDTQVEIDAKVVNSPAQIWTPPLLSSGYVEFYPLCAPSARLDVNGHGTANGTKIQIDNSNLANHYTNEEFQLFRVNPVLGVAPN